MADRPRPDEHEALRVLRETTEQIAAEAERGLPDWAVAEAGRIIRAWGRHDEQERERLLAAARQAGEEAAARIGRELRDALGRDPADQRVTPLQVARTSYREVTAVLREAGVPPIERDEFAERTFPDDDYGLAPDTFEALSGELASLHLTWGAAKAAVHKARHREEHEGG